MQLTPETATRNNQPEREPLKADELKEWTSEQETRDAGTLVEIMGVAFDRAVGVLRKHNGDMQKAADSLLRAADGPIPAEQQREADLMRIKDDFAHLFPSTHWQAVSDGRCRVLWGWNAIPPANVVAEVDDPRVMRLIKVGPGRSGSRPTKMFLPGLFYPYYFGPISRSLAPPSRNSERLYRCP
ncbi:hypothetical protein GGX14DRAFT_625236 [Mycena pura]|uniref:Uncharacterized protein n=1 Tax=Mycena pura TaxID=153505 RepID=A0AAD6VG66_9AGAR|nr:hypothetical protein GGX14DRAFT_625236 [Mycena pura]